VSRVPAYCPDKADHPAHDYRPDWVRHEGWRCPGVDRERDARYAAETKALTDRPTITIDAQAAATLVHRFDGGLAEVVAPLMSCGELDALTGLLTELGAEPNLTEYWRDRHEAEGACDDCADLT
jgi:hypothetical protein